MEIIFWTLLLQTAQQGSIKWLLILKKTARFFKEIITSSENKTPRDLINVYGDTQNILYGNDAINGIFLYVYPDKGIAYLGNKSSNTLFEIWYFEPTTMDTFITNWASGYSKQININQE